MMKKLIIFCAVLTLGFGVTARADDTASSETGFYPTWKLMSHQEKQQFVAGYLYAWKDAGRVTEIALEYIQQNPQKAVQSLQSIQGLYRLSALKPTALVDAIDLYFTEPENQKATLSLAVTSAGADLNSSN